MEKLVEQAAVEVQALFGDTVDDLEFGELVDRLVAARAVAEAFPEHV